jgi:fibronectin type 3 domain-containing protein
VSPAKRFLSFLSLSLAFTTNLGFAATVQLAWSPNPESDISGYGIYRTQTPGVGFTKINSGLASGASFTDSTVLPGNTYYYIITAVNTSGLQSAFSSEVLATVPPTTSTNHRHGGRTTYRLLFLRY